ncbi:hypothetical protein D3C72_1040630 [compost metagenome]
MGQIADRPDLGHARAAFEGVQIPLQGRQRRGVVRVAQPALQGLTGAFEDIHRFFKEDRNDFIVQFAPLSCRSELARDGR